MSKALGLVEFKTVPVAVYATDEMLKASEIEIVLAAPTCPGKYITIISGEVANVETSVKRGVAAGGTFVIDSHVIPNLAEAVIPALTGTVNAPDIEAIGIIETIAAVTSVLVGDIVVKAARVNLLEVRLARGLGGKGEVFYTGELGAVEAATKAALDLVGNEGGIVSSAVIPRPSKALIEAIA
ncbi:propanediol utilization: polyhedral bodies pduT [Spirochaetia bacterium]|nr:propanediol utilization: polyhedral bodies pduT [Spirochaetia bacterium]